MRSAHFAAPPVSPTNKILLIIVGVLFVAQAVLQNWMGISLVYLLGLSFSGVTQGFVFQLVSYPFVQQGLLGAVFSALILWFIGSDLEQNWGSRFYRKFLFFTAVFSGLFYIGVVALFFRGSLLVSIPLVGLSGINYALLVAYGIIYSERYLSFFMLFPMRAKYFCLLLGAIELYGALFSPHGKAAWAHVFAMVFGFGYLKFCSARAKGRPLFSFRNKRAEELRKSFRIVKEEDFDKGNDKPKYWH